MSFDPIMMWLNMGAGQASRPSAFAIGELPVASLSRQTLYRRLKTEGLTYETLVDDLRRRIMQMEIEEMALKKEDDQLSRDRLEKLTQELAELKDRFN